MTSIRRRSASFVPFVFLTALAACGGDGVVLPNESNAAAISVLSGDKQAAAAGAALPQPLVVRVVDGLDRPAAGETVAFTVEAGGGAVLPTTATTGADGQAMTAWTLGPLAGTQRVRAQVTGTSTALVATFTATAASGSGAALAIMSGDNQTAPVKSALADSLVVRVTDALGNPVSGVQVDWAATGGGTVSPASVPTDASGLAATERVLGTAAGPQGTQASSPGLAPVTFTHTAVAANPTNLVLISGNAQTGAAGQALPESLVVRLQDDNGNGVGGQAITWLVSTGGGSVSPVNVQTNVNGLAKTEWTLGTSTGNNVANAVFSGLPPVQFSATAGAGAPSQLGFLQQPVTSTAGSSIAPAVRVAIQDANGNTVTSATGSISVAIGTNPAGGALSGTTSVAVVNGVASFSNLSIDKAGAGYTLTASSSGLPDITSNAFDILTGNANRLVFIVQPTNRVVGQVFSPAIQVQAQDAGGNVVLTYNKPITLTSSVTGSLTGTNSASPVLGTATFSNLAVTKAGTGYTLTALASGLASATSSTFDVAQAETGTTITSKSPSGTSVVGQLVRFNYVVNIVDPGKGSLTGTVAVSDGTDSCIGGIDSGTGVGSCQVVFTSPGLKAVTATYSGDPNFVGSTSTSVAHTVNKANTAITITSDTPEPSSPGQPVHVQWTLSVTGGGSGTPTGTVTVSAGAGVTPCTAPASFGPGSCDLVFPTSGDKTITATYPGDGNFNGIADNEPHKVNAPPSATDDGYLMLEDGVLNVSPGNGVLKNDNDPDNGPQPLVAQNFSTPAHGSLVPASDGSFSYTPDADYNGTDTFTYEAYDGIAASQATVTITVSAVNDAPSFTMGGDETASVSAGPQTVAGWATNMSAGPSDESGQTLSFEVSTNDDAQFTTLPAIDAGTGDLTYTPDPLGTGATVTVTVRLRDNGGTANGGVDVTSDQTFTITLTTP